MPSAVATVREEAFDGTGPKAAGTVAVAFLAGWCPFCRQFEPEFRALASEGGATFEIADVSDEDSPLWDRFAIEIVPTVVVFRDGKPVYRADGVAGRGLGKPALDAIRSAVRAAAAAGPSLARSG